MKKTHYTKFKNNAIKKSIYNIVAIIMCLILCVSFFVYHNTLRTINTQIIRDNVSETNSKAKLFDAVVAQTESAVHFLSISDITKQYFNVKNSDFITSELKNKIKSHTQQITFVNEYVDSCYFFATDNDNFYDCNEGMLRNDFEYQEIASHMKPYGSGEDILIYPVKYSDRYPFYIRFLKQFDYNGRRCAVVLNLNIIKAVKFLNINNLFMVKDGTIIYSDNIEEIFTMVEDHSFLGRFFGKSDNKYILKTDSEEFVFSSSDSEYGWSYIVTNRLDSYYQDIINKKIFLYGFIILIVIIGFAVVLIYKRSINKSLKYISDIIDSLESTSQSGDFENNEIIDDIVTKILTYTNINKQLKEELEDRLFENKNLYFKVKQMQINPHFMFNVLNSINIYNMQGDSKKASQMILQLAKYMKYIFEDNEIFINIEKEIESIKVYLQLLQIRYPILCSINIDVDKTFYENKLIKFCLQPIVENSVYHGISKLKNRDGEIKISVSSEDSFIKIKISDNGVGMSEAELEKVILHMKADVTESLNKHIGLRNVYQRIVLIHGNDFGVDIVSEIGKGTEVILTLPNIS